MIHHSTGQLHLHTYTNHVNPVGPRPILSPPSDTIQGVDINSVAHTFDGACSNNGRAGASQACGVFLGHGNEMNYPNVINYHRTTSQVAELLACSMALEKVWESHGNPFFYGTAVLKSDSAYVVRGITEWLPTWKCKGWINSQGRRVANCELWQTIDRQISELEGSGIRGQFWHVPRQYNQEADYLAKNPLCYRR